MSEAAPVFHLPQAMRDEIIDHARAEKPRECCGVIAGRDGVALELFRTTNAAPGNELYDIEPDELFRLEFETLPEREMEIVAIYHSHPHSPARPSSTDISLGAWETACYLICSLQDDAHPVINGFYFRDGNVIPVEVVGS